MVPPLRIEFRGATYAVSGTANGRRSLFGDPDDRSRFLEDLAMVAETRGWHLYAWSVLPRSFRVVVSTPEADLSDGLRNLRSRFIRTAHAISGIARPSLRLPWAAAVLDPDTWLLPACRCVALDPVRTGLVPSPAQWPWSSYCATAHHRCATGSPPDTSELLARFSADSIVAAALYSKYVLAGIGEPDILPSAGTWKILGGPLFVQNVVEHLFTNVHNPSAARALLILTRPPLSDLFPTRTNSERSGLPARIAGAVRLGYTRVQIAERLGMHRTTVTRYLRQTRISD